MVEKKAAYRWQMLAYFCLINTFLNGFNIGVVPPLFPEISAELSLTNTETGITWGAWFLGMMLFSLLGGATADRLGVRKVVGVALIFSALFCALRGFMPGFPGLAVSMFFLGVSLGFVVPNLTKGVGIWFGVEELGLANGILIIAAGGGAVLGMMTSASILSPLLGGWRAVMWFTGALAAGFFILWIIAAKERPAGEAASAARQPGTLEGMKKVVGMRELWLVCLMEFCVVGGWLAFQGFFPTMLVQKGMPAARAGELLGLTMILAGVFNAVGPRLSDRVGLRKPFIWPFLLAGGAAIPLAAFFTGGHLFALLIPVVVGIGTAVPLFRVVVLETEQVGPLYAGSAIGLLFTLNRLGAFILPVVVGALVDKTGLFWPGFLLLGALSLVAAGLCLALTETGVRARGSVDKLCRQ